MDQGASNNNGMDTIPTLQNILPTYTKDDTTGLTCDASTQTERCSECVTKNIEKTILKNKVILLENEVQMLNQKLSTRNTKPDKHVNRSPVSKTSQKKYFSYEHVKDDNKQFKYYTGLTFLQFMTLWRFLGPAVNHLIYRQSSGTEAGSSFKLGRKRSLSPMDELFLTLMRLRLGLLQRDIGYRFGICQSSVSRIILAWVQFLYQRFDGLKEMMFTSRTQVKRNLPKCFKKFKNIRTIIDCTEIFVQQAGDFGRQGNLYSSYKGRSTLKVLVGIAPNGGIMYVSDVFEGSISDREIVKQSGFLDKLDKGDLVMADRGFTIQDLLLKKQVELNIPPFLNGRDCFTPQEEAKTKSIAKVRIHVE